MIFVVVVVILSLLVLLVVRGTAKGVGALLKGFVGHDSCSSRI